MVSTRAREKRTDATNAFVGVHQDLGVHWWVAARPVMAAAAAAAVVVKAALKNRSGTPSEVQRILVAEIHSGFPNIRLYRGMEMGGEAGRI